MPFGNIFYYPPDQQFRQSVGPFLLDYFYTGYNLEFPISGISNKENITPHNFMEVAFVSLVRLAALLAAVSRHRLHCPTQAACIGFHFGLSRPLARTTFQLLLKFYGVLQLHFLNFRYFCPLCIIFLDFFLSNMFSICSRINSDLFMAIFHLF